jgi:THAP domain
MKEKCVVRYCNSVNNRSKCVSFHKFPSNSLRREQWLSKLKLKTEQLGKHHLICGLHFSEKMFAVKNHHKVKTEERRNLIKSAYPDVSLGESFVANPGISIAPFDPALLIVCERNRTENITYQLIETAVLKTDKKREAKTKKPKEERPTNALQKRIRQRQRKSFLQRVRRLTARSTSMKVTLYKLRKQKWLDADATKTLCDLYASPAGKLIKNQVQNLRKSKKGLRYAEDIRSLALSIHYCSDAAYQVIR